MKFTLYGGEYRLLEFVTKLAFECNEQNIELSINGSRFNLNNPSFISIIAEAIKNDESKPGFLEFKPKDSESILIGLQTGYDKDKKEFKIGNQTYPEKDVDVIAIGRTSESIFYSKIAELDHNKVFFYEDESFNHSVLQFILKHPKNDENFEKSSDKVNKQYQSWRLATAVQIDEARKKGMQYLTTQASFTTPQQIASQNQNAPQQRLNHSSRCNLI